jgi:acetate kinase
MKILAINAGSTSIKFKLYKISTLDIICSGSIKDIGKKTSEVSLFFSNKSTKSFNMISNHSEGLSILIDLMLNSDYKILNNKDEITIIGHRIVHIGHFGTQSKIVNEELLKIIEEYSGLAPLHNPAGLSCIKFCIDFFKNAINVAVFDTSFHKDIPEKAFLYPIPYEFFTKYNIRKFGFHGIAYEYIISRALEITGLKVQDTKIVALMMGGGSSAIAFKNGKTIDTSMGFSPSGGYIPMSTRSGDVDPGMFFYLMKKQKFNLGEIYNIFSHHSGMLGLSEKYSDFASVVDGKIKGDGACSRAFNVYTYMIKKYIGSCLAVMNGVDLIIFGGGIGGSSSITREAILEDMDYAGILLDKDKNINISDEGIISKNESRVKIIIVDVDEELILARETLKLVSSS